MRISFISFVSQKMHGARCIQSTSIMTISLSFWIQRSNFSKWKKKSAKKWQRWHGSKMQKSAATQNFYREERVLYFEQSSIVATHLNNCALSRQYFFCDCITVRRAIALCENVRRQHRIASLAIKSKFKV